MSLRPRRGLDSPRYALPESTIDGWLLLDYIRAATPPQPRSIIIITGLNIASFEWSLALGALDIVKKPIDTQELLGKMRRYCPS